MKRAEVLVDSSVVIAAYLRQDAQHQRALGSFKRCANSQLVMNPLLASEVATVLLLRTKNRSFAAQITNTLFFSTEPLIKLARLNSTLWQQIFQRFNTQSSSRLSLADCSLAAQAKLYGIKKILTFDRNIAREYKNEFEFI